MANLTLSVDAGTLRRARIRALERGTSVNAVVREYLESYAGETPARAGLGAFLAIAEQGDAGSGPGGRAWARDDAHVR